ncbi:MAG: hypothetical protein KAQ68_01840 [Clostridiales bacterium]|nr:hypothetical protein [Clostridiales bacterium]
MHKTKHPKWYQLDTSAKIYPAMESIRNPAVFRLSMRLDKKIDPVILNTALEDIRDRFPYYNVSLKKGLFWNYLQQNTNPLHVWTDSRYPCERIYRDSNNDYLYKVKYYENNIATEFFHVLTDGFGGMEHLKCLVQRYLFLTGDVKEKLDDIIDIDEAPDIQEQEDAFLKVLESEKDTADIDKKRSLFSNNRTYQIKGRLLPMGELKVVTGIVSSEELKKLSREHDATITQFLAALYVEALILYQSHQIKDKGNHRNVGIQIPVNMRKYYPYRCMRNFSLFVTPIIDPREVHSLDDIIAKIKEFMKEHLTLKHLLTMVDDNCSLAKHTILKHVPVDIKNFAIKYIDKTKGSTQFSGTISNMGMIKLPDSMSAHVENVLVQIGAKPQSKLSCSLSGYKDKIYISFGRNVKSAFIEKHMFTSLVKMSIKVKLMSTS